MGLSKKQQLSTGTSRHALGKQTSCTKLAEATLKRSFQGVRIPSVTSRWSCSKTDKSNCCSHETLFHDATCGFKRHDAVNYAFNSGVGKTKIYCDSTSHAQFAGMTTGQCLMARGVRQGCPASGFLFAMVFDPIFRWLQGANIPRNPAAPDFLQPAPCAYADDFSVAASSF